MSVFKVAVDAGHGGYGVTPGKRTPDGEYEWNFNDKVVRAIISELKTYQDVEILRLDDPTGKRDIPLRERTNKANKWGADILVSEHHNANTGKWGDWSGTETFTYKGNSPKSERLAKLVHNQMVKAYGLRDRGLKKADFHMLRESNMPAILLEGCYMDSKIDIEKLRDDKVLEEAGKRIATGIAEYANLKKKKTSSTSTTIPAPKTQVKTEIVKADPPQWKGSAIRKGQIGAITILKPINLWRREKNDKLTYAKTLPTGATYRVYGFDDKHGGQYNVGGRHWVTNMDGYLKYETPSKAKLDEAKEYYK